ncbi:M23 family metallopeptidase [Paraburkholderia sp. J12]|uniref:M23 family metallopeptidase n=1 Tax=Paraburkholderia sp. J12 TaxID=2805432 RepID=UPI002ABDF435|nr:M23 family metallopeptidase [Paraburkholderia sp. J12]
MVDKASHALRSRYRFLADAVAGAAVLCGVVAMLGVSASATVPEAFGPVKASRAIPLVQGGGAPAPQPIEWIGQVFTGWAGISSQSSEGIRVAPERSLSDTAPLVMPQADGGSYAGQTEGTLLDSLARAGVPEEMQQQIVRIFSARVDFAAPARTGDSFRVIYERDDTAAQHKRVAAVELHSGGEVYRALWFVAPGHASGDYYSFDGQRLAAEPFSMPVDNARISSSFGYRNHPVKGKRHMHTGVDLAAAKGAPVFAAASGVVQFIGSEKGYGKYVVLRHSQGYTTYYAHLSAFAQDLRVGAPVTEGQRLGAVGRSGTATGPHLHFEVRLHNQPTDPLTLTGRTRALPLTASERVAFEDAATAMQTQLAALPVDSPVVRTASHAGAH